MKLAIVDTDKANLLKLAQELLNITPHVLALHKDVSQLTNIQEVILQVQYQFKSIDLLVNNAGVSGPLGPTWELPLEQREWTLNVNLKSIIYSLQNMPSQL